MYILRKILAVLKRVNSRLDSAIPIFSVAYCKDRSTKQHVFATKLITERTISSSNKTIY